MTDKPTPTGVIDRRSEADLSADTRRPTPSGVRDRRQIYLASSWRNPFHQRILALLREHGHEVYDFRNPEGRAGFSWAEIDPGWQSWTPEQYAEALKHPLAIFGFASDFSAMQWADTCVLLQPAGPSAAIEAGWCKGSGRRLIVHLPAIREPGLMYAMADAITLTEYDLICALEAPRLPAVEDHQNERPAPPERRPEEVAVFAALDACSEATEATAEAAWYQFNVAIGALMGRLEVERLLAAYGRFPETKRSPSPEIRAGYDLPPEVDDALPKTEVESCCACGCMGKLTTGLCAVCIAGGSQW